MCGLGRICGLGGIEYVWVQGDAGLVLIRVSLPKG